MKDAAETALDEIAAICGCPEWNYPGQVTRDVERLRDLAWKLSTWVVSIRWDGIPSTAEDEDIAHVSVRDVANTDEWLDGLRERVEALQAFLVHHEMKP